VTTAIRQRLALLSIWLLCQIAAVIASVWMLIAALVCSRRAWTLDPNHCEKSIEPDEGKPLI